MDSLKSTLCPDCRHPSSSNPEQTGGCCSCCETAVLCGLCFHVTSRWIQKGAAERVLFVLRKTISHDLSHAAHVRDPRLHFPICKSRKTPLSSGLLGRWHKMSRAKCLVQDTDLHLYRCVSPQNVTSESGNCPPQAPVIHPHGIRVPLPGRRPGGWSRPFSISISTPGPGAGGAEYVFIENE